MPKSDELSKKQNSELVELLMDGSRPAFGELYSRFRGRLFYYCKQYLKDEATAEDVVQDVFFQVWEKRDSLNCELSFSGYLHKLAENRILNMFRQFDVHARFVRKILENQTEATNQTEDEILDRDFVEMLNKALKNLSPRQLEVFRLSRMEGLTYKEIADFLRVSVPVVQEHATLALKKIKNYLSLHADIHFKAILIIFLLLP